MWSWSSERLRELPNITQLPRGNSGSEPGPPDRQALHLPRSKGGPARHLSRNLYFGKTLGDSCSQSFQRHQGHSGVSALCLFPRFLHKNIPDRLAVVEQHCRWDMLTMSLHNNPT
ncbi:Hypothetical predicted protein [Marmota monax]|uniref:Uncharacterized protein n=1 Tax=Marmota monax TaxID=9995 RepID=A0A5E4A901_MARMO|nr:hypothetical protein GHT09_007640 [Marmota monax]VTJ53743.1 Hypothetical predicted protein [Marmota monax]